MNDITQLLLSLGAVVGAIALCVIASELRQVRKSIARGVKARSCQTLLDTSETQFHGMTSSVAGFAIYVFRQGAWTLAVDLSKPGYEPSPPALTGCYEGQAIKRESRAREHA